MAFKLSPDGVIGHRGMLLLSWVRENHETVTRGDREKRVYCQSNLEYAKALTFSPKKTPLSRRKGRMHSHPDPGPAARLHVDEL